MKRSHYERCDRCKKLRKFWFRANVMNSSRLFWKHLESGEWICWICRIREFDVDWRIGKEIPKELQDDHLSINGRTQKDYKEIEKTYEDGRKRKERKK